MKHLFLVLFTLITLVSFQSCQKDKVCHPEKYPIVGLWIGTYKVTNDSKNVNTANYYYNFDIRDDGTMVNQSLGGDGNTYYSLGTWSLHGSTFTAKITTQNLMYAGVVQLVTATYDEKAGTLSGTVKRADNSDPSTASFVLKRVN